MQSGRVNSILVGTFVLMLSAPLFGQSGGSEGVRFEEKGTFLYVDQQKVPLTFPMMPGELRLLEMYFGQFFFHTADDREKMLEMFVHLSLQEAPVEQWGEIPAEAGRILRQKENRNLASDLVWIIKHAEIKSSTAFHLLAEVVQSDFDGELRMFAASVIQGWRVTAEAKGITPQTLMRPPAQVPFERKLASFDLLVLTAWTFDIISDKAAQDFVLGGERLSIQSIEKIADFAVDNAEDEHRPLEQITALYIESLLHLPPADPYASWFSPNFSKVEEQRTSDEDAGRLIAILGRLKIPSIQTTLTVALQGESFEIRKGGVQAWIVSPFWEEKDFSKNLFGTAIEDEKDPDILKSAWESLMTLPFTSAQMISKAWILVWRVVVEVGLTKAQQVELVHFFLSESAKAKNPAILRCIVQLEEFYDKDVATHLIAQSTQSIRVLGEMLASDEWTNKLLDPPRRQKLANLFVHIAEATEIPPQNVAEAVRWLPDLVETGYLEKERAVKIANEAMARAATEMKKTVSGGQPDSFEKIVQSGQKARIRLIPDQTLENLFREKSKDAIQKNAKRAGRKK